MALDLASYEKKASERKTLHDGTFSELSSMTGLKTFVTGLAGHVAAEAARLGM